MQSPDPKHVVNLPLVGRDLEHGYKQSARNRSSHKGAERVHDVGTRTHRNKPGECAVMHEARVITAGDERCKNAAAHSQQRVHGHKP